MLGSVVTSRKSSAVTNPPGSGRGSGNSHEDLSTWLPGYPESHRRHQGRGVWRGDEFQSEFLRAGENYLGDIVFRPRDRSPVFGFLLLGKSPYLDGIREFRSVGGDAELYKNRLLRFSFRCPAQHVADGLDEEKRVFAIGGQFGLQIPVNGLPSAFRFQTSFETEEHQVLLVPRLHQGGTEMETQRIFRIRQNLGLAPGLEDFDPRYAGYRKSATCLPDGNRLGEIHGRDQLLESGRGGIHIIIAGLETSGQRG